MDLDLDKKFHYLPADWQAAMLALKAIHGTLEPMSIQLILGIANTATQRYWNVDSELYKTRPTNLYLLNMTPTAGRKSTNFREVNESIYEYQKEKRRELEHDNIRYVTEEKLYKKDLKQYEKDLEDGIPAQVPQPPKPLETFRYIIKKTTLNGLIDQLKGQSWISIMSSEGGDFFNGHAWQGAKGDTSKAVEMAAGLTDLWDGQALERSTGLDRTTLYHRRGNMMLLLQESTVREVLNNSNFSEQGFIHRLLITQCGDPIFKAIDKNTIKENENYRKLLEPFNQRMLQMLRRSEQQDPERPYEIIFNVMLQSPRASELFRDYYNEIVPRATTDLREWAGFVNRCHEQALRIAATIADYMGEREISETSARAGIDLMNFYLEQRLSLDIGVADPRRDLKAAANKLSVWLEKHPGYYTRRELGLKIRWFKDLTTDYRDTILEELIRTGDVVSQERKSGTKSTLEFGFLSTDNPENP